MKFIKLKTDMWHTVSGEDGATLSITPAPHLLLSLTQWHGVRSQWPSGMPVGVSVPNDAAVVGTAVCPLGELQGNQAQARQVVGQVFNGCVIGHGHSHRHAAGPLAANAVPLRQAEQQVRGRRDAERRTVFTAYTAPRVRFGFDEFHADWPACVGVAVARRTAFAATLNGSSPTRFTVLAKRSALLLRCTR